MRWKLFFATIALILLTSALVMAAQSALQRTAPDINALSPWTPVASIDHGVIYASRVEVTHESGNAQMWFLYDYKTARVFRTRRFTTLYKSRLERVEYDCAARQYRRLDYFAYPESMGKGAVGLRPSPFLFFHLWRAVLAGTGTELLWRVACEKPAHG